MNRDELLAALGKRFQQFRKTPWFRITYLVLLGVIVSELYLLALSPLACVIILLIPVSIFVVPYWLGERKMTRFALNALVVFVIVSSPGRARVGRRRVPCLHRRCGG